MNRNHMSEEELADHDRETDNTAEFNRQERATDGLPHDHSDAGLSCWCGWDGAA